VTPEAPSHHRRREQVPVGERTTLESFLDDYRDIVVRKVAGLSDADARRRLVASPTTVGGLIKHLRWAEYGWFDQLSPGWVQLPASSSGCCTARIVTGLSTSISRNSRLRILPVGLRGNSSRKITSRGTL
jgi:uncharacterized protein DUF664